MTNDKDSAQDWADELAGKIRFAGLGEVPSLLRAYCEPRCTCCQPTQSDAMREALERIKAATCNEIRAGDKGYVSRYGIHGIASAALQEQSK